MSENSLDLDDGNDDLRAVGDAVSGIERRASVSRLSQGDEASVEELNRAGARHFAKGDFAAAIHFFKLAAIDLSAVGAQANLGRCEIRMGQFDEAAARARSLVFADAHQWTGWQLLGEALAAKGLHAEAIEAYRRATTLAPEQAVTHRQLGVSLGHCLLLDEACEAFARALDLNPEDEGSRYQLVINKRHVCDWDGLDGLSEQLKSRVAAGIALVSPIDLLSEDASASLQLACATRQAERLHEDARKKTVHWERSSHRPSSGRLRIGFVSAGFGQHPTAILTSALFEQLRNSPVEAHLFSTGAEPVSKARERLMAAAYRFHQVSKLTPQTLAQRIRAEQIELLVDLDGYSRACWPMVYAYRPAPVQIAWLGYPGTTGARYIDYVIADRFVLPPSLAAYFSEQPAYLSRCYQSNDPTRIVPVPQSRQDYGLPVDAVVFACFNGTFKLGRRSLDRMFKALKGVPGSVLWMLEGPGKSSLRLREMARGADIDPARLVFTPKLPHSQYLGLYRHADLFLDTEGYNAHTTASDALWGGCPVLTRPGNTFASRVAGSLNHHLGMPELNVGSDDEFVAFAIRYGNVREWRDALKQKLALQCDVSGLFDVKGFAADFADLLARIAKHHRSGGRASNFLQ
ncbi:tetratricopeptide repeat protein [Dyella solisilvae]|nr:tetratricopeptide repeat protein [Dyella solisilvae]